MRVFGLTGGIASGKSTAARFFSELGVPVIDADQLSRELVEPGQPALREIAERFPGALGPDERLDRAALAAKVFGDPAERLALEAILHPRIRSAMRERAQALARAGNGYALYEAALIFEGGHQGELDGVVLVAAPETAQRARLVKRDGLGPSAIEERIAAQLPLADKRRRAQWVLENDGDEARLRAQVAAVHDALELLARSR